MPEVAGLRSVLILAVLLAAGMIHLLVWSGEGVPEPLPWDEAHHYLGASEMRAAMESGSLQRLREVLLAEDMYPPGHSILLGLWMLAFGEGHASLAMFHLWSLWLCFGGLLIIAASLPERRREGFFVAGSVLLLATIPLLVLAGTFMVETPAAALLLAAMGTAALLAETGRIRHLVWASVAGLAVLLTKYNIGLPLLPAYAMLSASLFLARRRRNAFLVLAVLAVVAAGWAAFLSLQTNGWAAFMEFARNRANSAGMSFWGRLWWYMHFYASTFYLHPIVILPIGLATLYAFREKAPVVLLGIGYFLAAMVALGRHEYLLDRNMFAPAMILVMLAGVGVSRLVARHPLRGFRHAAWSRGALVLAAIVALVAGAGQARVRTSIYKPPGNGSLAQVSRFMERAMEDGTSMRVVGTFNWLSAGWMRILAQRQRVAGSYRLAVDFPYPGVPGRSSYDSGESADYARVVEDWLADTPEELVATIQLDEESPFRSEDFRLWSAWKGNYCSIISKRLAGQELAVLDLPEEGLHARVYYVGSGPVRFGEGWGPAEEWGRWAMAERAFVTVPGGGPLRLGIEYAAFEGMEIPQNVRVLCDEKLLAEFSVTGRPWEWERQSISLPPTSGTESRRVVFEFAQQFHGYEGDDLWRCLPVHSLSVQHAGDSPPPAEKAF